MVIVLSCSLALFGGLQVFDRLFYTVVWKGDTLDSGWQQRMVLSLLILQT